MIHMMKCMVCERPTIFTYKICGVEAAFCPKHLPKSRAIIKIKVRLVY